MADESDDDPQLKSLRAVWLEMRDEDPPSRGLDALMAAARSQATVFAKPSLWKRFVDQLRRPPVLAFASLALLIGGAVVLTRHDDAIEKAQPTSVTPREIEAPAGNSEKTTPTAAPSPVTNAPAKSLEDRGGTRDDQRATHHKAPRPAAHGQAEMGFERPAAPPPPPPPPATEMRTDDAVEEAPTTRQPAPGPKAAAPKVEPAPAAELAAQLATQMRSAQARGDCENAKAIAARIARQDPAYYRERVAAEISKCDANPPKASVDLAH